MTIQQIINHLVPDLPALGAAVSLYGSVALALLTCFFGFRLRYVWYTLLVFAVGALLGLFVSRIFLPDRQWLCVLIGLGAGLLAAAFTFRIYQAVVFLLAFGCVFFMAGEVLGMYPVAAVIAGIALGVIAGLLAARFQYRIVILVTAASGGWQAASLLRQCVPSMTPETVLILAAAFIVAGAVFQFMTTRKLAKK